MPIDLSNTTNLCPFWLSDILLLQFHEHNHAHSKIFRCLLTALLYSHHFLHKHACCCSACTHTGLCNTVATTCFCSPTMPCIRLVLYYFILFILLHITMVYCNWHCIYIYIYIYIYRGIRSRLRMGEGGALANDTRGICECSEQNCFAPFNILSCVLLCMWSQLQ